MLLAVVIGAAVAFGPVRGEPPETAYFRNSRASITAGAQCHYADGSKAVLLRTKRRDRQIFILREQMPPGRDGKGRPYPATYRDVVIPLEFDRAGHYHHDANGGVTTYHMIELAVDHLLKQAYTPLTPKTLDGFLRATKVPKCRRATFDADLYDNR